MIRPALTTLLLVVTACHFHRDTNAPGIVDPTTPPVEDRRMVELPGDPGERIVYLSPGAIVSGGPSSVDTGTRAGFIFDGAIEVTLGFGEEPVSHNDNAARDRLFLPPGWIFPRAGYGVTLGWSALRLADGRDATTGPLYLEAHKFDILGGAGAGWSYDPSTGNTGPELFGYFVYFHTRARWMMGEGAEILFGAQLKWPLSWVSSR